MLKEKKKKHIGNGEFQYMLNKITSLPSNY